MAVITKKEDSGKQKSESVNNRIDLKISEPGKYEIVPDTGFTVRFACRQFDGRWVILPYNTRDKGVEKHWCRFRFWNWEESLTLKKEATNYNRDINRHIVNYDYLDRLKVQKLLQDWSFSEDNERLKLHHHNGVLTDESFDAFKRLHTNIVRYIVDEMNKVLEGNA